MKILKNSEECTQNQLDLFSSNPTNASILSSNIVEYSLGDLKGKETNYEFNIPASESYTDLSSIFIKLKVKIQKLTGEPMTVNDSIGPINNFGHSLFDKVQLSLGPEGSVKNVEHNDSNYSYKAYFLNLFNYGIDSKETWLENCLFVKDDPGKFEIIETKTVKEEQNQSTLSSSLIPIATNSGYIKRRQLFIDSKGEIDLYFPIHCDLFHSDRYLISHIPFTLKLSKNSDRFLLMGEEGFNVLITSAILNVRTCEINNTVKLAHLNAWKTATIKYPIKQNHVQITSIPVGVFSYEIGVGGIQSKTLPNKILFGLISDEAYNGSFKTNPFNFLNFDVTYFELRVDGQSSIIEVDYENNKYIDGYHALCDGLGFTTGHDLTKKDYSKGNAFYFFNLNPDKGCMGQHNLIKTGSMQIKIKFKKAVEKALKLVIFFEHTNQIEIDNNYNINFDYTL
jgi:hypothetical protein